jgi:adenylate cyclase
LWLPVFLPVVSALSVFLVITSWRVLFEQSERRHVKSVFSKLVSPDVVSELLGARELSLGGARREITVFFADVRGFTSLTDRSQQQVARKVREQGLKGSDAKALIDQQAKQTLNTVNLYLALVADAVKKHNGTLDKYIGDCVMAFWGAPTPNRQHALHCVRAAIDSQRAIERVNRERAQENETLDDPEDALPLLALGSGINTGEATVGLMGSDAHILNYTVFGREVNVASRLEGVSGRGRIIISETTYNHLQRDDPTLASSCVHLESVSVKGISDEVKIYEVPWREEEAAPNGPANEAGLPA